MLRKRNKSKSSSKIKVVFIILILNFISVYTLINFNQESYFDIQNKESTKFQDIDIHISANPSWTKEWLDNGNFSLPIDPWYNETDGDTSDVNASLSNGYANFELLGDLGSFSTAEAYPNASGEWKLVHNPDMPQFPTPDPNDLSIIGAEIDTGGWWVNHLWSQGSGPDHIQWVSAHWRRDFTLPVDLSDYEITSVDFEAIINATVQAYRSHTGGIDVPGDTVAQSGNYDSARFYVIISNTANTTQYTLGYNKTKYLGSDAEASGSPDGWHYWSDKYMTVYNESILIAYLESVFQNAPDNKFSLILGIDLICEDNEASDIDSWDDVRIKSANLSFTYEKEMDRYSALSWNQKGNKIPNTIDGQTIEIDDAQLNFSYKIDKEWPGDRSPNSEIRIKINNFTHPIPIKLNSTKTSFQEASLDVTSQMTTGVNITTSIEVILLENFLLNETYVISIDNASLIITYSKSGELAPTDFDLFLNEEDKTLPTSIEIDWGELVNITFIYKNDTGGFIPNATVQLLGYGPTKNFTENKISEYYNITIDTNKMGIGENYLTIYADKDWYVTQEISVTIDVIERSNEYEVFLNGLDKSDDKSISLTSGHPLNITVKLRDTITTNFTDNATLKLMNGLIWTKNLTENKILEQYSIILNTAEDLSVGITFLTLLIEKENYTSYTADLTIALYVRYTELHVFLNSVNKTSDPMIDIPIGPENDMSVINITAIFIDTETRSSIENATVFLTGEGYNEQFNEDILFRQYSILIDTRELDIGLSYLSISAEKQNYSVAYTQIKINVQRISAEILNVIDNESIIEAQLGEEITIQINLWDSNFERNITGATIIFTSNIPDENLRDGTFTETEPGVYEIVLKDVPEGTFILTISVLGGGIYDDYEFDRYDLTVNVKSLPENVFLFQLLTIVAIIGVIVSVGYVIAYQKVLKYPKPVRKVRKFKRMLRKEKYHHLEIPSRQETFISLYNEEFPKEAKYLKPKIKKKQISELKTEEKLHKKPEIKRKVTKKPKTKEIVSEKPGIKGKVSETPKIKDKLPKTPKTKVKILKKPDIKGKVSETPKIKDKLPKTSKTKVKILKKPKIKKLPKKSDIKGKVSETPKIKDKLPETPKIKEKLKKKPDIKTKPPQELNSKFKSSEQQSKKENAKKVRKKAIKKKTNDSIKEKPTKK